MENEEYSNEEFNIDEIEKNMRDQFTTETAVELGKYIGTFYISLIDNGIPEDFAMDLVFNMVNSLFSQNFEK